MFVTCVEPGDVVTVRFNVKQDLVFTILTCKMIILINKQTQICSRNQPTLVYLGVSVVVSVTSQCFGL